MPFPQSEYEQDFDTPEDPAEFHSLIARAGHGSSTLEAVRRALEAAGIEFLPRGERGHPGPAKRLSPPCGRSVDTQRRPPGLGKLHHLLLRGTVGGGAAVILAFSAMAYAARTVSLRSRWLLCDRAVTGRPGRGRRAYGRLTAAEGGWRIVLVDGAEEMNRNAANALSSPISPVPSMPSIRSSKTAECYPQTARR